jgi:hypothetical protein
VADLVQGAHPVEDMPWTFHCFAASYLLDAACHATQSQKRCANPNQSTIKHKTYKKKNLAGVNEKQLRKWRSIKLEVHELNP